MPEPTGQAGAIHTHRRGPWLIEREVRAFVASDTFADVWVGVNTRAQQTVVRVLQVDRTGAGVDAGRPGGPGQSGAGSS